MERVKKSVFIGGVVAVLSFGLFWFNQYKPVSTLHNFPVPNHVVLMKEQEVGKHFEWLRASEEHGIPFDYEMVLKLHGWKKGEREGAAVKYTKGNHIITLISTTDRLELLKEPLR